jgi:hypothetical protein
VAPGASYREDSAQLLVPLPEGGDAADALRSLLEDLVPEAEVGDGGRTL